MGEEPIIIVGGEPNSVFLEIFFKSLKLNTYRSPLIIVVSKKLLKEQMRKLDFDFKVNDINKKLKSFSKFRCQIFFEEYINIGFYCTIDLSEIENKINNLITEETKK